MSTPSCRDTHGSLVHLLTLLLACAALGLLSQPAPAAGQALAHPATPGQVKPLATFPAEPMAITAWMAQQQWTSARHDPRRCEVGNRRLRLVSQDDSIMIGTTAGFPVDPRVWPRLRVRLRITQTPTGTDNTQKSGDDAAFRLYVAFARGKTLFGPPHTLVYVWTENVPAETLMPSPYFRTKLRYLSIGQGVTDPPGGGTQGPRTEAHPGHGGQDEAGWVTIERDLLQDYRRAFPDDPPPVPMVEGIMLKCDSNNTGTSAEAWLATLELLPPVP